MKRTLRKKLATWGFLRRSPPERHFPAREGRAELTLRIRGPRPETNASLQSIWHRVLLRNPVGRP